MRMMIREPSEEPTQIRHYPNVDLFRENSVDIITVKVKM